jgi:hypothetical protein
MVSVPVDLDFELYIGACALNLINGMLTGKYKTTLEED